MSRRGAPGLGLGPEDIFTLFTGPEVPDPITFVIGEQWLDRGNLYPRQATLLKLFFLRDDLFTEYDHMVLNEWIASFASTGNNGVQTDIYRRIAFLKADGYRWFREILLVMGRRAGKGHISALAFAYVLWNYLSKGDPQGFYGVDPDKQLACFIFAGKKEQAKLNLFGDLYNVITSGPCFTSYISRAQTDSLTVYAPHDFIRMRKLAERGLDSGRDMATFLFQPKESTMMAGRGPASFMQGYDEMAHVVASGANRSAEEVYCLDPETRVLCADLIWRPIKDLQAGDELVGFDEEPVEPGGQRKLRHATVRAKWKTRGAALRITFEDGTGVVCSPNHRWFRVSENCNSGKWVKAGYTRRDGSAGSATRLMVGDYIRHLVDPWETDTSHEGGWLAGILDGEGWVSSPKSSAFKIGIAQNPGMVLERAERLLKEFGFEYARLAKHPSRKSVCENLEVRGIADVLRLLGQLRPVRLLEKSRGVWDGKTPRGYTKHKRIVSIEELPEQDLIDIETSTGTFVAEGLVSHNSASTPALDQFGKDAFIVEPSSPWQKTGQFYENYQHALEVDEETGAPVYPEVLMIQLASWDIYKDWERAHEIELFPAGFTGDLGEYEHGDLPRLRPLKGSIQTYDLAMQRLERANPETFKVERRSDWANVMDAYLNENKVKQIFQPWMGRPERYGRPTLEMQESGLLIQTYKAHADPSKSNCNFGFALGHAEEAEDGTLHCVFDKIHHWEPQNWDDGIVDYDEIGEYMVDEIAHKFYPDEITFDQFNSVATIQKINKRLLNEPGPKQVTAYERTATKELNWSRAEVFKTAINMGLVHAPYYELAETELSFLIDKGNKVVDHPDSGPVQTKDVADCMFEVVYYFLGKQIQKMLEALGQERIHGGLQGGTLKIQKTPQLHQPTPNDMFSDFGTSRRMAAQQGLNLSRGYRRR
jgi:hypothetical protein